MATKPQHYHWQKKLPFLLLSWQHFAGILSLSQWLCRKSTTWFMSRHMRRHFSPVNWTAWQAYCACLFGHVPASHQSRHRCWERFAGVLGKAGRETNFQSFCYIPQRIFPDNSSITLGTCSLHMFSICLSVFIGVMTRRTNTIASCRQT